MIPTLNAMPAIQEHVLELNKWIHHVGHVVVVDSQSTDGTMDYLREHLAHDRVTFIDRPPGLYESWNEGISHIRTKYTYISTVGDLISAESLGQLYEQAEEHRAPVVISPPKFVSTRGKELNREWPIHEFIKEHVTSPVYYLSAFERLVYSCVRSPKTLIGSSASNLYLTRCLQETPFPADFGHGGDSIWALTRPLDEKWIILKDVESTFVVHERVEKKAHSQKQFRLKIYDLTEKQLLKMAAVVSGAEKELIEYCLTELADFWTDKETLKSEYRKNKEGGPSRYLGVQGWSIRKQRSALRQRLLQIHSKVDHDLLRCKVNG